MDQKILDNELVAANDLCYYTGCYSTILTLIYITVYTIPRFKDLIYLEVQSVDGDWIVIAATFIFLCLNNVVHNDSYFFIIDEIGSVTAGILQALRAVLVFFVSSFIFCATHSEQCLNFSKIFSAVIVIGSVLLFIYSGKKPRRQIEV